MKAVKRIFVLLVVVVVIAPPIFVWKFPGRAWELVQRAVEDYRSGISGPMKIDDMGKWEKASQGIDYRTIRIKRGEEKFGLALKVVRMDPAMVDFKVITVPGDQISDLTINRTANSHSCLAIINGSFFNHELGILGLAISDGVTVSQKTVAGENRGIFLVKDEKPELVHRDVYSGNNVTQAIQSGPWLVSSGKAQSTFKKPHRLKRRSAVCMDSKGHVQFVITDTLANGITLPDLAKALSLPEPEGPGCVNALNLDGGTSSQMLLSGPDKDIFVRGFVNVPVYLAAVPKG